MPLAHVSYNIQGPAPNISDRFQIVFIPEGTGIAVIDGHRQIFIAPAVFFLNEKEKFAIAEGRDASARIICFHPCAINNDFDFTNIRGDGDAFSFSAGQDLFWLRPFLQSTRTAPQEFTGHVETGPLTAQKIARLFDAFSRQLDEQPANWPCRGRSYLIELLFLLQQVYSMKGSRREIILPDEALGMDKVILFLYTNYQRRITIQEMAGTFNTNRTTLMKSFHEATHKTIKSYLIDIRIKFAASLIRDTMLSLSEIMERVGFSDLTHFSRTFKICTGYLPSDYRQKFCWMLSIYPDFRD